MSREAPASGNDWREGSLGLGQTPISEPLGLQDRCNARARVNPLGTGNREDDSGCPRGLLDAMNQDQPLRRLLDELQAADAERQGQPRDTPAYTEALNRVDRLMKAVWQEAHGASSPRPPPAEAEPPDRSTDL
jgi:hypothetical protein